MLPTDMSRFTFTCHDHRPVTWVGVNPERPHYIFVDGIGLMRLVV